MEFVMVPVPEAVADEVLQYVRWKTAGTSAPRRQPEQEEEPTSQVADIGEAALVGVLQRLDARGRALLTVVASDAVEGRTPRVSEVAQRLGMSERETMGTMLEVNQLVAPTIGKPFALLVRAAPDAQGGDSVGGFSWRERVMVMSEVVATSVLEASRS